MEEFSKHLLANPAWQLVVALAIGLLIGAERERHKDQRPHRAAEGLRTFALVSLLGGLVSQTGSDLLTALSGAFVMIAALLGYAFSDRRRPGLTTEVAFVGTFFLGTLTRTEPLIALATGVVVTVLLAWRNPLHHFVRDVLTEQELSDGLIFCVAALVIWPFLPDRAIDAYGMVNPFAAWRVAVVLMGLSAAGYVAARLFGPRYGLTIAGFASGFISSSIGIATMGGRARQDASLVVPGAAGAVASILGSLLYFMALVSAANPEIMAAITLPLLTAAIPLALYAAVLAWRARASASETPPAGRAFDAGTVAVFAGLVVLFAAISAGLIWWLGQRGAFASAIATGLIDAHAAAVSIATLIASGKLASSAGAPAILVALSANMAVKIPGSFMMGPTPFAIRVSIGLGLLLTGLWSGYAWVLLAR